MVSFLAATSVIAGDYEVLGLASDLCHYFGKLVLSFIS
jgi:hypothetical protein